MTYAIVQSNFNLISWDIKDAPNIEISGNISRINNHLNIRYLLTGSLSTITIPEVNQVPLRRYDLWEHTCLEFFLRLKGTSNYWEFNISPSRNWNVFRFLDYRLNIIEEQAFDSLPFKVSQDAESLTVEVNIDLNKMNIAERDLDLAITAVVEDREQQLSYWALNHPAAEADFHHQDSFIISL